VLGKVIMNLGMTLLAEDGQVVCGNVKQVKVTDMVNVGVAWEPLGEFAVVPVGGEGFTAQGSPMVGLQVEFVFVFIVHGFV